MFRRLLFLRFLVIIIVVFTFINALAFIVLGVILSIEGILALAKGGWHTELRPGLTILESLDIFLVALVFLLFAIGIAKLFLPNSEEKLPLNMPKWLNINSFTELKLLLWEAVLTTLVVLFISDVIKQDGQYSWELLVIPASIILLSLSVFILKKHEN